jgi:dipeptidyl aminopeptidase/acylaminoacyl peptidase
MEETIYTIERIPYAAATRREFLLFYKGAARPDRCILFLHGHGDDAWRSLPHWATPLADTGFLVILPTLVGYASIKGERSDFGGPRTISDLETVVEQSREILKIWRLGLWGISRGAMAAALVASNHPDWFDAIVLQAGTYDFRSSYETTLPRIRENIDREVSHLDDEAFRQRTSLVKIGRVKAPILVLHGIHDESVPVEQAYRLKEALDRSGADYHLELVDSNHYITQQTLTSSTLPFLRKHILEDINRK